MGGQADDGEEHRHQVPLHTLSPGRHKEGQTPADVDICQQYLMISSPGAAGAGQTGHSAEVPQRRGADKGGQQAVHWTLLPGPGMIPEEDCLCLLDVVSGFRR